MTLRLPATWPDFINSVDAIDEVQDIVLVAWHAQNGLGTSGGTALHHTMTAPYIASGPWQVTLHDLGLTAMHPLVTARECLILQHVASLDCFVLLFMYAPVSLHVKLCLHHGHVCSAVCLLATTQASRRRNEW